MTNSNENEEFQLGETVLRGLNGLVLSFDRRYGEDNQGSNTCMLAINLIKEQQAEIEAARKEIERLSSFVCRSCNGHGLLGRSTQDGSMESMDCPDCSQWQLVPIEPTDDMLHEMRDTTLDYELDDLDERRMSKSLFNAVYKAMLKAAPKPEDG